MKAKIYIGAKKYALYIGRKIVQKTLEFLTIPARFVSKKVQDLKNYLIYGNSVQNGTPTPTAPVEIESVGEKSKNLFDKNNTLYDDNMLWYPGGRGYSSTVYYGSNKIPVEGGKTYTRTYTNTIANYFRLSDNTYKNIENEGTQSQGATIVAPEGAVEYYFNISRDISPSIVQVVEGDTLQTYQPYGYKIPVIVGGTTTNIYLDQPLRKIGDYADYIDFENQKVVRNVGSLLLNTVNFSYISGLKSFNSNVIANTVANMPNVYCEAYKWSDMISTVWANANKVIGINVTSTGTTRTGNFGLKTLAIKDTDFVTQTELKNAIGNAKVYYVLATPTEETITLPVINLEQGTLTIDTDTNIKPSKMIITGDIDNE